MDLRCPLAAVVVLLLGLAALTSVSCNVVFEVQNKLKPGAHQLSLLSAMRSNDAHRHSRLLSAVDLPLGGSGDPSKTGLYFTKIKIGTPPRDYYVQVDTGSDILWLNCVGCDKCPAKSDLGIDLTPYDPKNSHTGKLVTCNQDFCILANNGPLPYCKPDIPCPYNVLYGDESSTSGYFIEDNFQLDHVIGNFQTSSTNSSAIFGCAAKQSGGLGSSSEALDGILGFGQANSSILSQLASAGMTKKKFAHCLDSINGGGIFAVGNIVQPKVNTTPMVPNMPHYNVIMKAVEVGGNVLQLPSDVFDSGDQKGTVIDSGTTLAYLPEDIYDPLLKAIMAPQPQLKLHTVQEFTCFQYTGSVDKGFPEVKFYFDGSLTLTVYPHDYLFQLGEDAWCFGWQNSKDEKYTTLLGDLVLSDKLVIYDVENQVIGWTEYNCSSSIKVKDDSSGAIYSVGGHVLSAAPPSSSHHHHHLLVVFVIIIILFQLTDILDC